MKSLFDAAVRIATKVINRILRSFIGLVAYFNTELYMKLYLAYLRSVGVQIDGVPKFINRDVYFDGSDYGLIRLGDNVVISREVMFLTHDYSLTAALGGATGSLIRRGAGEIYTLKEIEIGANSFIGARVSILPGVKIGANVIVGAGSVVVSDLPDNVVAAGNPCRPICLAAEWSEKKLRETGIFYE